MSQAVTEVNGARGEGVAGLRCRRGPDQGLGVPDLGIAEVAWCGMVSQGVVGLYIVAEGAGCRTVSQGVAEGESVAGGA